MSVRIELQVAEALPCSDCIHEPVCAIRRAAELAPNPTVELPDALGGALSIEARVTCDHYATAAPAKPRGRRHSPETRARMAEAHRRRRESQE